MFARGSRRDAALARGGGMRRHPRESPGEKRGRKIAIGASSSSGAPLTPARTMSSGGARRLLRAGARAACNARAPRSIERWRAASGARAWGLETSRGADEWEDARLRFGGRWKRSIGASERHRRWTSSSSSTTTTTTPGEDGADAAVDKPTAGGVRVRQRAREDAADERDEAVAVALFGRRRGEGRRRDDDDDDGQGGAGRRRGERVQGDPRHHEPVHRTELRVVGRVQETPGVRAERAGEARGESVQARHHAARPPSIAAARVVAANPTTRSEP